MYTTAEIRSLRDQIDGALTGARLSAWQRRFLSDMAVRIERYGPMTRLSEKQSNKLNEILGRGCWPAPLSSRKAQREQQSTWLRKTMRFVDREERRFARRFVRQLAVAGAIVCGFVVYSMIQSSPPAAIVSHTKAGETISRHQFTVIDGDTIRLNGARKGTRLVGFNAPEIHNAACRREQELGDRATSRLEELVATADLELVSVACACTPGTEGTDHCNYGRSCGTLLADGRDVGAVLISEGLAVPFVCGATSCPPTPRPWCE